MGSLKVQLHYAWSPCLVVAAAGGFAILGGASAAVAQPSAPVGRFSARLAAGVNSMRLNDFKDSYSLVVDGYRQEGLQLETQREFPANLIFGGDLLYDVGSGFSLGAGARYSWTRAFTLYQDYSGTLDILGKARMLALQAVGQRVWSAGRVAPFVELRGGWAFVSAEITEQSTETFASTGSSKSELESNDGAPLGEAHLGIRLDARAYLVTATGGYRYCKVSGPEGELREDGVVVERGELSFDVDVSGFVFAVAVGRSFP